MVGELVTGDAVGTLVVGALGLAIGEFDGLALGGGLGDALGEVVGFLDGAIVGDEVVGLVGGAPPPFTEYSTPPTHPYDPEDIDPPNSELKKETSVGLRSNKFSSAARGVLLSPSTAKRPVAVM